MKELGVECSKKGFLTTGPPGKSVSGILYLAYARKEFIGSSKLKV